MYHEIERSRSTVAKLEQLLLCPASFFTPRSAEGSSPSSPNLFRWIAVRDAIIHWHESTAQDPFDDAVQSVFARLKEPHQSVCIEHLRTYTQMADRSDDIRQASDPFVAVVSGGELEIASWPTFLVERDEAFEVVKLRTGASAETSQPEAAVLSGGRVHDGLVLDVGEVVDLNVHVGDAVKVDVDEGEVDQILAPLVEGWERLDHDRRAARADTRPGQWCYSCDRIAYCGAYPRFPDQPPAEHTRVIKASKSTLGTLTSCERKAAWKVVHQLPTEQDDVGGGTGFGLRAHEVLAAVVAADDPLAAFETMRSDIASSEVADLQAMVEAHVAIESDEHSERLRYEPEAQLGVVFQVEGVDPFNAGSTGPVVVAMLARADAVNFERDIPVVVDHKTSETVTPLERELLAVLAAARQKVRTGEVESVEVHYHFLRREPGERCEVSVFDRDSLNAAYMTVRSMASQLAQLDPFEPATAEPKSVADAECERCEYREWCGALGGPV